MHTHIKDQCSICKEILHTRQDAKIFLDQTILLYLVFAFIDRGSENSMSNA